MTVLAVLSAVLLHRQRHRRVSRCRGELPGHSPSLKSTRMPCPPAHAHRSSLKVLSLDRLAGVGDFNGAAMLLRQWFLRYHFLFHHFNFGRILLLGQGRTPSQARLDRCFQLHTLRACTRSEACACSELGHGDRREDPQRTREAMCREKEVCGRKKCLIN